MFYPSPLFKSPTLLLLWTDCSHTGSVIILPLKSLLTLHAFSLHPANTNYSPLTKWNSLIPLVMDHCGTSHHELCWRKEWWWRNCRQFHCVRLHLTTATCVTQEASSSSWPWAFTVTQCWRQRTLTLHLRQEHQAGEQQPGHAGEGHGRQHRVWDLKKQSEIMKEVWSERGHAESPLFSLWSFPLDSPLGINWSWWLYHLLWFWK